MDSVADRVNVQSVNGHCGPKNNIQAQSDYCGTGCQPGFGVNCNTNVAKPPNPPGAKGTAAPGGNCGPIVNMKCGNGECCSGSNYCGTGSDYCGASNWCQSEWGTCA